jgi:hypothetical protein
LDQFVRATAKVDLIDRHIAEHGLIGEDGEVAPAMRVYTSLLNSARLSLARLESHVDHGRHDPSKVLIDYLDADNST